jgi:hypothetical protein
MSMPPPMEQFACLAGGRVYMSNVLIQAVFKVKEDGRKQCAHFSVGLMSNVLI